MEKVIESKIFQRSQLLLGADMMSRIYSARVIIFGVGGVGSWCAESLVRSGIRHLTIVDTDDVAVTNCNRQLMATTRTVGRPKVEVMRERLLDINPDADVTALQQMYSAETAELFAIGDYDYVIDAIDSLKDKAHLIMYVTSLSEQHGVKLFSSMGAALRIDPTQVRVAEFWKVHNDTLARALRKKFKHNNQKPAVKFQCVFSEELPMENLGMQDADDTCDYKARINGSLSHITGIFGLTLAGLVMQDIQKKRDI